MNWKKFSAECQEVNTWLTQRGYTNADVVLLKIVGSILRGETRPESMLAAAGEAGSLKEIIHTGRGVTTEVDIPERLHEILSRWPHSLSMDAWILGEVYERLAPRRRSRGLFYTAPEIIDFILNHTVEQADILTNPLLKVLDPACGSGYFLLKAYDVLWQKFNASRAALVAQYPEHDWSEEGIHRHIIAHNLWGADIDPVASDIAATGLLLKRPAASSNLLPNILVCDSLRRPLADTDYPDKAFWSANYDYVVGNPPYLSFGLRGTQRLDPDYAQYLRQAFSASAEYKLSYYVLFMERGIEMLVQGGKLGFIVPDSFLLGRYYSKIRRYIMENTAIETIAHIAAPVFKDAAVGMSAICILSKEQDARRRAEQTMTIHQVETKNNLSINAQGCCYGQSYFASQPHNRFRIFSDLTVKNLVDKIDTSSLHLAKFASGHTGVRSVSRQSDIVATTPAGESWQRGLISGGQVQRYGLTYEGHWLNISPDALYKGGWDPAIVKQRKILIRQTGYSLTACIDEDGYYHLNNLHSFVRRSDVIPLDYLLLLLNSRLMSFYYHAVSMEYGRAMAQTDIDTLELLPIRLHEEAMVKAPELVRIMQELVKRQLAGDRAVTGKITAMDDLFNQLVYRVYELDEEAVNCIERYETKLAAQHRQTRRVKRINS